MMKIRAVSILIWLVGCNVGGFGRMISDTYAMVLSTARSEAPGAGKADTILLAERL